MGLFEDLYEVQQTKILKFKFSKNFVNSLSDFTTKTEKTTLTLRSFAYVILSPHM